MLGTLRRAGAVLDLFTTDEPEWGVTATARQLGIGKSLAHDVLVSLTEIGLLERVAHGRYRLGWRTVSLAAVLVRTSDLKANAGPVVRSLADATGSAVRVVAWERGRIVRICSSHQASPSGPTGAGSPVTGTATPLGASAEAKVLLSERSRREVEEFWLREGVERRHPSLEGLERELEEIRTRGWARDDVDHPFGRLAVAAPIRDGRGMVVAAISLQAGDTRSRRNGHHDAHAVIGAATRISAALRQAHLSAEPNGRPGRPAYANGAAAGNAPHE